MIQNNTSAISEINSEKWDKCLAEIEAVKNEIAKIIVGQDDIVEEMLIALICRGHCLIIGVPGLAKTLLIRTLGQVLDLSFNRIQFTPDMMPSDIIGCEILQNSQDGKKVFEFVKGPIFSNLILADEINRTPPKTQSALLEAMQELQVSIAGNTFALPEPFLVFATQNPIEHEGTYPLPEAQLDRFFFSLKISYPSIEEERAIVANTTVNTNLTPNQVLTKESLAEIQELALDIPVPEHVMDYILNTVHSSRPESEQATDFVKKYVAWGAGPRASQNLTKAAKALALLNGNPLISIEDVKKVAPAVLRHRIIPNYNATGEGISVDDIIAELLSE